MRHPLHPALVHFPIGSWSLAVAADVGSWWWPQTWLPPAALALLVVGCVGGVAAAAAGFAELMRLPDGHPAARLVNLHMGLALSSWSIFAVSLFVRVGTEPLASSDGIVLFLDVLGMVCLLATGYLGGSLVYGHGVGRD
ncbi:MAG: DUF2231 domain-containing protein [Xanthomonadales bacterium]|nr:DUF2231 domain-containing protein [Xanthomonadales bacterium]